MSEKQEHTALPWEWVVNDYSMITLCGVDDYLTNHVMSVSPCEACMERSKENGGEWRWGACTTPSEANAALIVCAVNAHHAMLEALEELEGRIADAWPELRNLPPMDKARAAIRLGRG